MQCILGFEETKVSKVGIRKMHAIVIIIHLGNWETGKLGKLGIYWAV